jgi:hypothetical protein
MGRCPIASEITIERSMPDLTGVTTSRAAEIVGIGYEGFRSYLKRGLLGNVGTLPPFYGRSAKVEVLYAKRWKWSKFHFPDLCLIRLAKMLMDAGLSFDNANVIASDDELWRYFSNFEITQRQVLVVSLPNGDYCVCAEADWNNIMGRSSGSEQVIGLINLAKIHARILAALTTE